MGTFYKPTLKGKMLECFPVALPKINGEPTTRELIRVLQHNLILCSQTHEVGYCKNNLLFLVIEQNNGQDSQKKPDPINQWNRRRTDRHSQPVWTRGQQRKSRIHRNMRKKASNCNEMNKVLDEHYQVEFTREFIKNPSVTFKQVFLYYTEQYGSTDGDDWLENEQRMKAEWHPSQGFHTLVNQLEEGLLYG